MDNNNNDLDRRAFLQRAFMGTVGASMLVLSPMDNIGLDHLQVTAQVAGDGQPFKGIFPIMQTPFLENGDIDHATLRKEVDFIVAAGGHGMAWPQLASEFYVLGDDERLTAAEVIVKQAAGRRPVIIGVQSTNHWKVALKFANHAAEVGADGIISLPPYPSNATVEQAVAYYETLAETVDLPIFIQNSGGRWGTSLPTAKIVEIGEKYPHVFYVKEEASPVTHRIGAMIDQGKEVLNGVFSGGDGTTLLNELRRGCAGSMTGVGMVDIYVKIYHSFVAGEMELAQEMFDKMMSFQMFKRGAGWLPTEKSVLKERGVFVNTRMRVAPYDQEWDAVDHREFKMLFDRLRPYFSL